MRNTPMTKHSMLDAVESLLYFIQLDNKEIEQIYNSMNETDVKTLEDEINKLIISSNGEINDKKILQWLKTMQQKSPEKSMVLQNVIAKNTNLFDKIQEIFAKKLLDH